MKRFEETQTTLVYCENVLGYQYRTKIDLSGGSVVLERNVENIPKILRKFLLWLKREPLENAHNEWTLSDVEDIEYLREWDEDGKLKYQVMLVLKSGTKVRLSLWTSSSPNRSYEQVAQRMSEFLANQRFFFSNKRNTFTENLSSSSDHPNASKCIA